MTLGLDIEDRPKNQGARTASPPERHLGVLVSRWRLCCMTLGLDIQDRSQDPDVRPVIYRCLTAMVILCFPELVFRRRSSATLANMVKILGPHRVSPLLLFLVSGITTPTTRLVEPYIHLPAYRLDAEYRPYPPIRIHGDYTVTQSLTTSQVKMRCDRESSSGSWSPACRAFVHAVIECCLWDNVVRACKRGFRGA